MHAVVLSDDRRGGGELVLNAEFLHFAAHWGFQPRSCRPYRAQTKGKVERPIRYLRDSFFYGRTFANDEDLNEQAWRCLEGTANVRRHGTTGERAVDRFERDERGALRPLAGNPIGASASARPRRRPGKRCPRRWRWNDVRCGSMRRRCDEGVGEQPARPPAGDAGRPEDAGRPGGRGRRPGAGGQRGDHRGRGHRAVAERPDRTAQQPRS